MSLQRPDFVANQQRSNGTARLLLKDAPSRAASRRLHLRLPVLPFCADAMVRTTEQNGAMWHVFDARDVPRFFAQEKYTCFYWHGVNGPEDHLLVCSLDALEQRLVRHGFLRVHRGELVNLRFLCGLKLARKRRGAVVDAELLLADGQHSRVSRRRLSEVRRVVRQVGPQPGLDGPIAGPFAKPLGPVPGPTSIP